MYGWLAIINGKNSGPAYGRRFNVFIWLKRYYKPQTLLIRSLLQMTP
jgi:hypothetical protein